MGVTGVIDIDDLALAKSSSRTVQPDTILGIERGFVPVGAGNLVVGRGRPRVSRELRELIQRISKESPL